MITFLACLAALIAGYFLYAPVVERVFSPSSNPTPAFSRADGVDFVPLSTPRAFLIQLLNIAGLGPIFGAVAGALWGPAAFLWITLGTLFAGAVHDYLSGMISLRHDGASIPEIVGIYLSKPLMQVMRIFSVVLLLLVGTVFMTGPAGLLARLTPQPFGYGFWLVLVLAYYFLATVLPIDQLIGRIYPLFGVALLIMAAGIAGAILLGGWNGSMTTPELVIANLHPKELPLWPLLFVTIACGAISGFHATQSPMMARCIRTERDGRRVFYGAMVCEGIIALIWAAAAITFYHGPSGLAEALTTMKGPGGVVYDISIQLLGPVGGVLAILGVIACPITSGDTAFRSARLTLSDWFGIDQKPIGKRLALALPLLGIGAILSRIDFNIVWRYFAWSNQTLAMLVLWTAASYLRGCGKNMWIAVVPATFMSAVCATYLLQAPEGFGLATTISHPIGCAIAIAFLVLFLKHVTPSAQRIR